MTQFPEQHLTAGGQDPFLPSLLAAINHASEISIATAFIRLTGLRLLQDALMDALRRGARLRILTGDYLSITDPAALRHLMLLQEQGADVKVFESGGSTSFHMKAYLFTRPGNSVDIEGCAFIGSSNITQSALADGLEWNLRVDHAENPKRFEQILAEYDALFGGPRCKHLTHAWIEAYSDRVPTVPHNAVGAPGAEEVEPVPMPNALQQLALDALAMSRDEGFQRGLVVMATGLGKTWLAAFDSRQFNVKRLLFVAHREEILNQAEATFVRIRPDCKVGRYDGKQRDLNVNMLFASIQTLSRTQHLQRFAADYFDYIVVDEFHHAAARSYQRLLAHFRPHFLLGLTATPERTDQSDLLALCDDNLVFQRDLFDGIKSRLLCTFHYYGIADVVDYQEISWRNGKFDPEELVNQLATQARARHSYQHWQQYRQSRTLAFCISRKHADFMAAYFQRNGVAAVSVHSTSEMPRNEALSRLEEGELDVIFSVDLFNEGVDLPAIDTVLMLRPTDSKIVFLQQLGRGLRNSPHTDKDKLVVLDFIGNHVSFFRKPEALFQVGVTNKARREFVQQAKDNALNLPDGCFVNYDLQAVDFMQRLTGSRADQQEDLYRSLRDTLGRRPTLAEFYRAGGAVDTVRREHGDWLGLVQSEGDLSQDESRCVDAYRPFFAELETTNLTKSFKLVLLEALLELDGFNTSPATVQLAIQSFAVLQRRRPLWSDLPVQFSGLTELGGQDQVRWHHYWLKNPINAWVGGNKSSRSSWFSVQQGQFLFEPSIAADLLDTFATLTQELINYRFFQYEARLTSVASNAVDAPALIDISVKQEVPYFSDLRIACGHFRTSAHESENIELRSLPESYGKLEPAKHFIARASGDSMNGGTKPIKDGDYLLLELITAESAGSNDGKIIAIEQQDVTGDDQYLLRTVKKDTQGQYQLIAQNSDYPPMVANEDMATFARLKAIVDPLDLFLHQAFMREEIPALFGLEFNSGLWNSGHVCPKGYRDQFLLVTLNKQGKAAEHQYHDYFIDQQRFHWQSQNSTTVIGAKGRAIVNQMANQSLVHLFVRKNKLQAGKAAPFIYCGTVSYLEHSGEKPMSVQWRVDQALSDELFERLN
jgi:superfamily II DNA or RNA helicase/HKD family nuclease/SOS-response transcriptional repressor LexA